jgi:SAM-dependent methyltransferase
MQDALNLFDRNLLRKRRARAARDWAAHDFLKREAVARVAERIDEIRRDFPLALDLGGHQGEMAQALRAHPRVGHIVTADLSEAMARRAPRPACVCDEELLPFAPESFDLVTSVLSLHHVNDLPGVLIQLRQALKADGALIAVLYGANSLRELRSSLIHAAALGFGLSPRLSPLVEIRDAGALLQRAGFALPIVDNDLLTIEYQTAPGLLKDLRGMGETHLLKGHLRPMQRDYLAATLDHYETHHRNAEGYVTASVEFITLTGWKPHPSQPQPLKPGSATQSLKNALS